MIFRKPYAFFIKYFRIINLIMAVLMAILIYRTFILGHFLTSYIEDYTLASNNFILSNYINFYIFLLILLVIIFIIIVLSVMFIKQKPKKLYLFNLIVYILLIIIYGIDYGVMHSINESILDIRVSKALRDITYIALFAQIISFFGTLIRATGFDIKQFDFGRDLQELEIDVKDNEEFEVAFELDKNKANRNLRNKIRETKYFYIEHKFLINIILVISAILIIFSVFAIKNIYTANYNENQIFNASTLSFNIKNSYITNTDTNGKQITKNNIVVVKIDVKKFIEDEQTLNTGLITLIVNKKSYGQTSKYNGYLSDIGTPYTGQDLDTDFNNYILSFEIPKESSKKTMKLKINDNISYIRGQIGAKNNYIKLKPIDLTKQTSANEQKIGDTTIFTDSILGDSTLTINKINIGNKFKTEYQFCSKKDKCTTSYEYVTPTATGNYFKTLLQIDGTFNLDENMNLEDIDNIYYFLNKFATIYYQKDGTWYSHKINSERIKPKIAKDNKTYIEVNKDIEKATSIYLIFNVRNYTYKYILK